MCGRLTRVIGDPRVGYVSSLSRDPLQTSFASRIHTNNRKGKKGVRGTSRRKRGPCGEVKASGLRGVDGGMETPEETRDDLNETWSEISMYSVQSL